MPDTARSTSFELLAEPVRRWIWMRGWRELRDIQECAIPIIVSEDADLIVAAATAGGKTEAAFLPLLSRVVSRHERVGGFNVLYVSPLKALINDQFRRLDELCEMLELPVHRWHGDVSASAKARARKEPSGVLLITPESLEAFFVLRGRDIPRFFAGLECVVIDELHALLDTERGMHLRSLLARLEQSVGRSIRRIGLSATLGDMALAAGYLRPSAPASVRILASGSDGHELRLQVRGYVVGGAVASAADGPDGASAQEKQELASHRAIATHLFERLRGSQNLVFAGSRQKVELYADLLGQMAEGARLPNEFYAHHANLARDHREFVEQRLKDAKEPTTAVCTSTLELGIDIGEVESVAQIGAPYSVASMRQRLGRSGRRAGKAAVMRVYVQEQALDPKISPLDELRLELVQAVAMIELLLEGWCEPPRPQALHLSTFVHQVLSVIAERGGTTARLLYRTLCERGPFGAVDQALVAQVLRAIGAQEVGLIEQSADGTLLLGSVGERLVEHYSFYAVFMTPEEYRVISAGRTLGTLPVVSPLGPAMTIIFSGRRWTVLSVDARDKAIEVAPAKAGRPPKFGGDPADIHDHVAKRMREVYESLEMPSYLDGTARELLAQGRRAFDRFSLDRTALLPTSTDQTILFPWRGTVTTGSLALALNDRGIAASPRHVVIEAPAEAGAVRDALDALANNAPPRAVDLAMLSKNLIREKYHPYLSEELLAIDMASERISTNVLPPLAMEMLNDSAG